MRTSLLVALTLLVVPAAKAQVRDTSDRGPKAMVSGVVHDSIGRGLLKGAIVQLVAPDRRPRFGTTVISDSLGRFAVDSVPDGRYTLGFFHPLLDSLGMQPPMREVTIVDQRAVQADLSVPSPSRFRRAICGDPPRDGIGTVIVGSVLDARGSRPIGGARVKAEWIELTLTRTGVVQRVPVVEAVTSDSGWFALCNVPAIGAVTLVATLDADSTGRIEVTLPPDGLLRRDLFLAPGQHEEVAKRADSTAADAARPATGARVSGVVVDADGGRPLSGAQVGIPGGPQTHAGERGEWSLTGAPLGTHMVEVRAFGYYPARQRVDVVQGSRSMRIELSTLKAVLDTVRIRATRGKEHEATGFDERRRSGNGQYFTASDIQKRQLVVVTDLFTNLPGMRIEVDKYGQKHVRMRSEAGTSCSPGVYLNGASLGQEISDDIDTWVRPGDVTGIEVYSPVSAPAKFRPPTINPADGSGLGNCGSILVWTR